MSQLSGKLMLKMLYEKHADPHKQTSGGDGALELAKWSRDSDEVSEWLKSIGVQPHEPEEEHDHGMDDDKPPYE